MSRDHEVLIGRRLLAEHADLIIKLTAQAVKSHVAKEDKLRLHRHRFPGGDHLHQVPFKVIIGLVISVDLLNVLLFLEQFVEIVVGNMQRIQQLIIRVVRI